METGEKCKMHCEEGMWFDTKLTWQMHINKIIDKCKKGIKCNEKCRKQRVGC